MGLCMAMIQAAGIDPPHVIGSGGGFESPLWTSMHATAFGMPILRAETPDSAACGAALLAAIGTGALDIATLKPANAKIPAERPDPTQRPFLQALMEEQALLQRTLRMAKINK
jgi:sugar (pentulose or hexulose) kinase